MWVQVTKVHNAPIILLSAKMLTFFLIANSFLQKIPKAAKKSRI